MQGFAADLLEQEFDRGILTGECDGGEKDGAEPRIRLMSESFTQDFESLLRVCAGDGESGFGGGIAGGVKEAGDPGDCAGAFDAEDAAIAGSEDFWFVVADHRP